MEMLESATVRTERLVERLASASEGRR
jgi:hypothetical protein